MKTKLLAWSMAMVLCLSGIPANAFAEGENTPTIEENLKSYLENAILPPKYSITIEGNQLLIMAQNYITQEGCVITPQYNYTRKIGGNGEAKTIAKGTYGFSGDWEVNELIGQYYLLEAVHSGKYAVKVSTGLVSGYFIFTIDENLNFSTDYTEPNHITAFSEIAGDVNGDGNFTLLDVVTFQKWLSKKPYAIRNEYFDAVDMNGDGILNVIDMALIKKQLITQENSIAIKTT